MPEAGVWRRRPSAGDQIGRASGRARFAPARSRRRLALAVAYVIFGAALFIAFLAGMFPYEETISAMLAPMDLKLVYGAQRMNFPLGAKLADVQLLSTASRPYRLVLRSPETIIAPTLASLLLGRPGLRVRARIYGGAADATIHRKTDGADVVFTIDSLDLAAVATAAPFELHGAISGSGDAELMDSGDFLRDAAHVAFTGGGVTIKVIDGLPPIRLGAVVGAAALSGGVVTVSQITASGDDAAVSARGTIRLGPEIDDCVIDFTISLTPTAAGGRRFKPLLAMLPHPPAHGPYYVSGTLASPSLN